MVIDSWMVIVAAIMLSTYSIAGSLHMRRIERKVDRLLRLKDPIAGR